jgi:hypothetical protein
VNAFLEEFYRLGPSAHGVQGVLREFLEGPTDGVRLTWRRGSQGLNCDAHDGRGAYRIDVSRRDGRWFAFACSCLAFQEFRRECRHLRAARQALVSADDGARLPPACN